MSRNASLPPRWGFYLLSLLLGLGVALIAAEGGLRLGGWGPWRPFETFAAAPELLAADGALGWVSRPGRHGDGAAGAGMSDALVIGPEGARGPLMVGEDALWVMGGSFAFGLGVPEGETLSAGLGERWPGARISNVGVPGYGTLQAWMLYQRLKAAHGPPGALLYALIDLHEGRNVAAPSWRYALDRAAHPRGWAKAPAARWEGAALGILPPQGWAHWRASEVSAVAHLVERGAVALGDWTTGDKTGITLEILRRWALEAEADGVGLSVALLEGDGLGDGYGEALAGMGIPAVDLRSGGFPAPGFVLEGDGHPTARAYAAWADALAEAWPEGPPGARGGDALAVLEGAAPRRGMLARLGAGALTGLGALVVLLYSLAALMVGCYAASQLGLLIWSGGSAALGPQGGAGPEGERAPGDLPDDDLPVITLQLPIFNERRVVRQLLASMAALDWPRDRLEIQVLDDSDDETTAIAAEVCDALCREGLDIQHLRRPERKGYKAGALAWGLARARGAFIAIFDADFRPDPAFLRRAMGQMLTHPEWGLLQARWGHLNRDASVLTIAQAFHLDAHFGVEQAARSRPPLMMGFNGTAGIWRRGCIEAAGGWSADTLTEDLDLAIRAQLSGWRLAYQDGLEAPAELPEHVQAIRSQQHRWMKGGAQVARKLLGPLWRHPATPVVTRILTSIHLLSGLVFWAVVGLCVLTPLLGPLKAALPWLGLALLPAGILLQGGLVCLIAFYLTSCVRRGQSRWAGVGRFAWSFPLFMSLSTGLALHNALAVGEGLAGRESPFVRTPKRGGSEGEGAIYAPTRVGWETIFELALGLWGMAGLAWALSAGELGLAVFLAVQSLGFLAVAGASFVRER